MGGHEAGEIASEITVNTLAELAPSHLDAEGLTAAVEAANYNVMKAPRQGIGATAWAPRSPLPCSKASACSSRR